MKNQPTLTHYPLLALLTLSIVITTLLVTSPVTAETALFQSPPEEPLPTDTPIPAPTATPIPINTPEPELPAAVDIPTSTPALAEPGPQSEPILPGVNDFPQIEEPDNGGGKRFSFDRAEYIDTLIIFGSWIWLCCGILIFLSVPLLLLLLQIRGSSLLRKQRTE